MAPRATKKSVLVASRDPVLADVRKHVLQDAGYRVIPATTVEDVAETCQKKKVHLVLIGYSLPPAEKRRFWASAREHCKTPILELHNGGGPTLMDELRTYMHHAHTPDDFLSAVERILNRNER